MLETLNKIMSGGAEHSLLQLWSGQLSEAEAAAIRARAKDDPKFREEYLGSLEILAAMEELETTSEIRAIAEESRHIIELRRSKRRAALGIAAGVVLAVGAALLYIAPWSGPDNSHLERHFTRIGEQKTIDLDDGSVVTLNTATQLVVDYSEQDRKILLERGEALFEVAEDRDRPFTVELGVRSVTALGTVFNIRKHPERYHVAVLEGAVYLHPLTEEASPSAPPVSTEDELIVIEAPTQRRLDEGWVADFEVSGNRMIAFQPESMERYQAWRTGMLRFYREPLYQVVQELNRYTRKKILIEDAAVMELSVYAAVSVKELDSALNALEQLLPIKVTKHYDRIVITGSEKKTPAKAAGS